MRPSADAYLFQRGLVTADIDAASIAATLPETAAPATTSAAVLSTTTATAPSQQSAESHHAVDVVCYLLLHDVDLNLEPLHFALRSA
jgi:hypothetical protein